MRARLRMAVTAGAVLVLTGCVTAPGTAAPTTSGTADPSATGAGAESVAPTPGTDPAASRSAEPATPESAPPSTSAPATEEAPYCGDEFVLAMLSTGPGMALDSVEEVLEQSGARVGFEPATAIDGLDVRCTATYGSPTDGAGLVTISVAVLLRDDAAFTQLEEWSATNGYEPAPGSDSQTYAERYAPATPDGMTTTKILWMPLDSDSPTLGDAPLIIATTGAPPDAIMVWFSDYTQP